MYISHMRNETDRIDEALEELFSIARGSGARAEIYHLKTVGRHNWPKIDHVIDQIERARSEGLDITADVYPYAASGTGLDATMPAWVQEGGLKPWIERLR